jgi:hypothetical protein
MGSRRKLGKLKPTSELTEGEWVRELEHIDNQLTHVLDVFNFLEELFRLSNESEAALGVFNSAPLFWHVFRDCLQEALFMGLGRLCDLSSDVVNVRRVLLGAMAHPEFFTAEALRRRLAKPSLTESYANHLIGSAWVPGGGADLRFLKEAVSRHLDRIEQIHSPIRDCYYGHRLTEIDAHAMFERTNREEIRQIRPRVRPKSHQARLIGIADACNSTKRQTLNALARLGNKFFSCHFPGFLVKFLPTSAEGVLVDELCLNLVHSPPYDPKHESNFDNGSVGSFGCERCAGAGSLP